MNKHYIIPIFVPHLGCPHDCIFCNQKKIASAITDISPKIVEDTIQEYLGYFKKDSFVEVAFYGGSFTAIDINLQNQLLEVAYRYKKNKIIDEIRLSTRPDAINKDILDNLKEYYVDTIELGAQSMNQDILDKSERGHSVEDIIYSSNLIKNYGFKLGLQMMIGLPGDNLLKNLHTAKEFINLKADCVRIYPTLIIKDTYLEKLYKENKYTPLSIEEAVEISSPLLILFYLKDINVIRVGLQPTENIQLGKDVIDGPFHSAFRQLVESNIYRNIFDFYFNANSKLETKDKILEIKTDIKRISDIAGQKSSNLKYLVEKYGFKKISFIGANEASLVFKIGDFYDEIDLDSLKDAYISSYFKKNNLSFILNDFNIKD